MMQSVYIVLLIPKRACMCDCLLYTQELRLKISTAQVERNAVVSLILESQPKALGFYIISQDFSKESVH